MRPSRASSKQKAKFFTPKSTLRIFLVNFELGKGIALALKSDVFGDAAAFGAQRRRVAVVAVAAVFSNENEGNTEVNEEELDDVAEVLVEAVAASFSVAALRVALPRLSSGKRRRF